MDGDAGIWEGVIGTALQALVLVAGGIGGLILYVRRREFQPKVRVGVMARISRPKDGPARVFVRLHMVNECGGHVDLNARIVLWSVTTAPNTYPKFTELGRDFPMDYTYGEVQTDGVMADPTGHVVNNYELEPLECIETEVLFCPEPLPDLMAVRASLEQDILGRDWPWFWRKVATNAVAWETFAYVDPAILTVKDYVALTSHEANE